MKELFNDFIYIPLYNILILLISILPGHSVALAVIVLTILVKLILLPGHIKMIKTQQKMKELNPTIKELKEKYKDDPMALHKELVELYKKHDLKPFSSLLNLFIQIPVIIGLYLVFYKGGLPEVNFDLLYSFVNAPETVNIYFLGIDLTQKSIILASVAGVTQYIYAKLTKNDISIADDADEGSFKADLQKSLQIQLQYVFPVLIAIIAYSLSSVIALYFIVSNLFMIIQEKALRFAGIKK